MRIKFGDDPLRVKFARAATILIAPLFAWWAIHWIAEDIARGSHRHYIMAATGVAGMIALVIAAYNGDNDVYGGLRDSAEKRRLKKLGIEPQLLTEKEQVAALRNDLLDAQGIKPVVHPGITDY